MSIEPEKSGSSFSKSDSGGELRSTYESQIIEVSVMAG